MAIIKELNGTAPKVGQRCFLAENASLIGDVTIGDDCSIWYGAVLRGDVNPIVLGDRVNIQDGAVLHTLYKRSVVEIGNDVSVGHNTVIHGAKIGNNVLVGIEICPISNYENAVSILPLSHTFGLVFELLVHLEHADRVFLLGKHFSFGIMLESFQRVQPRILQTVPMMMEQLYCRFGKNMANVFGQNLYHLFVGGSSLRPELEDTLLLLGIPLTVGYGSTETAPLIASSNLELYLPHSVGQVVSGMEARISDNGEILVRGKNVMLGYYKNLEATRRKIDADGWLHTGDRGWIDKNNNVFVYGRLEQDMIVLPSGENIIPQNIEALLNKIDGVEESLVLERSGRLIALVYQRTASMDKSTLLRTVNLQLPPFSQLADIEFVSEPFQRTGKSDIKRYLYS